VGEKSRALKVISSSIIWLQTEWLREYNKFVPLDG